MTKRVLTKRWIVVLGIVLLVAGAGYRYYSVKKSDPPAHAIPRHSIVKVERGDLFQYVSSTGIVTANRDLELTFDVGGKVKWVNAAKTQTVEEGTVLVELDQTRQELAYLSAKREYELAKFDAAPTVLKEKELALQVAKADLEAATLSAPFTGLIAESSVQEDEWVSSGTPIMRLLDTSRLFLNVSVDEIDVRYVDIEQSALVSIDAYPEVQLLGRVVEIGIVPESQGQIVVFPVKIEIVDPDPRVRVGMSGEAEIVIQKAENAIIIPFEAVVEEQGTSSVNVVKGDDYETIQVITGLTDGFSVEIVEGLNEGDEILVGNPGLYRTLQGGSSQGRQAPLGSGFVGGVRR
ncbi:MAG: efflux RND transporter periplasmic adaptor subunit [Firmicutes bacterium]|nr:efflux RND transporter periplasmic adaptor subunit [Bacillota bacterium]